MRRSWVRPPWVSLRKRMTSKALTSRTFLTVWSFFLPLNTRPVEEGPGGGRCAVRSRHGHKGGGGRSGWCSGHGCGFLRLRRDDSGGVRLGDAEALGEGRERAGGGVAEGAQRRQQCGQEDVNPLM